MMNVTPLLRKIQRALNIGKVSLVDDHGSVQRLQVKLSAAELYDSVPRLAEYGFTSNLPDDSDVVTVFVGGDRSGGVVIASGNQQYRLKNLQRGEVALYDDLGHQVIFTRTGIVINAAGHPITINGDVQVNGTLSASADLVGDGKSLKSHVHSGVQIGGGNTGAPV